jgi:hypothetical protein
VAIFSSKSWGAVEGAPSGGYQPWGELGSKGLFSDRLDISGVHCPLLSAGLGAGAGATGFGAGMPGDSDELEGDGSTGGYQPLGEGGSCGLLLALFDISGVHSAMTPPDNATHKTSIVIVVIGICFLISTYPS